MWITLLVATLTSASAHGAEDVPVEAPESDLPAEEAPESDLPAEEAPESDLPAEEAPALPYGPVPTSFPALPTILESTAAAYPSGALVEGLEAEVVVTIDIDAEGTVLNAFVGDPVGHGFDEAAVQAVRNFSFSPAYDADGARAAARIEFAYRFTLDHVPLVTLEGTVESAGGGGALFGATVLLEGPEEARVVLETSEDGSFRAADLVSGSWRLSASMAGFGMEETEFEVVEGSVAQVTLYLAPHKAWQTDVASEQIVVEATRLKPEVTERRLSAEDLRVVPGTNGDIVRAVQSMPGVARTPYNTGQLLVRGTAPADSRFYLGGTELPLVYHFGGFATIVASDSLSEVLFLPGGYGVRYGRSLGGVVDLITDRTPPDGFHGFVSVDIFQSSAFLNIPLGKNHALSLSGRQSYIHIVLNPFVNVDESTYQVRLPRFGDAQVRWLHTPDNGDTHEAMVLLAEDGFSAEFRNEDAPGGFQESVITINTSKLWLRSDVGMGKDWRVEVVTAAGPHGTDAEYDDETEAFEEALRLDARVELTRPVPEEGSLGWRMGAELQFGNEQFVYDMTSFDDYFTYGGREEGTMQVLRPALYAEQSQKVGPVLITPGVRADWMATDLGYKASSIDPRASLEWSATERSVLRASAGNYSQFPQNREISTDARGNPELGPSRALQLTAGWDQELTARLQAELTVYHSTLADLVVGHEDRFEFALAPPPQPPFDQGAYANDGTGEVWGAEGLVRYESPQTFGWVGLTLSRSTRIDRQDQDPQLYRYDQPLIATAVISHKLPRNWRVGGRFRYGSGNPYTPITNRIYDLRDYSWIPIYGDEGVERLPAYITLDLRVDKEWPMRTWVLTTYVDIQNATNRRNVELVNWSSDYSDEIPVYGLPVLPAFGLKGAW